MQIQRLDSTFVNCTVSYGTFDLPDLLQAFHAFLLAHYPSYEKMAVHGEVEFFLMYFNLITEESPELASYVSLTNTGKESFQFLVHEILPGMLNVIAPPGTSFGSHPGCGSDLGFWLDETEDEYESESESESDNE